MICTKNQERPSAGAEIKIRRSQFRGKEKKFEGGYPHEKLGPQTKKKNNVVFFFGLVGKATTESRSEKSFKRKEVR